VQSAVDHAAHAAMMAGYVKLLLHPPVMLPAAGSRPVPVGITPSHDDDNIPPGLNTACIAE
jgi:hypothetical protein